MSHDLLLRVEIGQERSYEPVVIRQSSPRPLWFRQLSARVVRLVCIHATLGVLSGCGGGHSAVPQTPKKLGKPSNDVDPKVIGAAVRKSTGRFQRCFEDARKRNPSLSGLIEVRFLINSDGTVGQAEAAETNLPDQVARCIVNTFYDLKLPQQEAAVIAQYPLFFEPS